MLMSSRCGLPMLRWPLCPVTNLWKMKDLGKHGEFRPRTWIRFLKEAENTYKNHSELGF